MEAPIKILFAITKKEKSQQASEILNSMGASAIYVLPAKGVGHNDFLKIMGLEDLDCDMIISAVREDVCSDIILTLKEKLEFEKSNQGLAFSVKISAISKNALYGLLNMNKEVLELTQKEEEQNV